MFNPGLTANSLLVLGGRQLQETDKAKIFTTLQGMDECDQIFHAGGRLDFHDRAVHQSVFLGRPRVFFVQLQIGGDRLVGDHIKEMGLKLINVFVGGQMGVEPLAGHVDHWLGVLQFFKTLDIKSERTLLRDRGGPPLGEHLIAEEIHDDEARHEQQHHEAAFTAGQRSHFLECQQLGSWRSHFSRPEERFYPTRNPRAPGRARGSFGN